MTEEVDVEAITLALRFYLTGLYVDVTDFDYVIENRVEVSPGVYEYECPGQTLWLNNEHYAVTYDRQKVTDGKVYYRWTDDTTVEEDISYEYLCPLEWKKTRENGAFLYCVACEDELK